MTDNAPNLTPSMHVDRFTRRHALAVRPWPDLIHTSPHLRYPKQFNAATALLDDTAARYGRARRAIVTESAVWSYAELLARANQIAHVLHDDLRVVSGNRVLLMGANSPWFIACLLAILEAGAVAVPLPPIVRGHELNSIVDAVDPSAALCDADSLDALHGAGVPVLEYTDELRRRLTRHPIGCPRTDLAADDVALILISSGTTGNPKASLHFHRDLLAVGDTVGRHLLRLRPDDLVACNRSMALTYGLGGLVLSPLRFGAASLLSDDSGPESLFDACARHRADVVLTTPSGYRAGVGLPDTEIPCAPRRYVSGGEHLDQSLWHTWHDRTGRKIIDIMGATELTNGVLGATEDRIRPGSTGLPVPGYQARVVDENGHPCQDGEIGQLAVRGPTGCRYLNHPRQLTAIRDGWTLTGDLCRRDSDGYFWMRGRTDDAISIDGCNVVPAEVEAVLLSHPVVTEAAVVGYPAESGTMALAAYIVLTAETLAVDDLTELLTDRLSRYEHPRTVTVLPSIPRTTTGKIDRAELRRRATRV
ncbi:AMP-binding protein [Nocardia arthritidis]|uniref:AMP-binding protein n=1 Tax=Nocardia arthritidis TaxID=228602 RepID=A0A6G9YEM4_9NOCA|nr:AMP-binding protein [Nocardia arthritidis]QIS11527.1 AMP-binding protein [Nocardia arthritidis]